MLCRLPVSLTGLLCVGLASSAIAAEPAAPVAAPAAATSFASIVRQRSGLRTLAIDYPWKIHRDASVEVRLVTDDNAASALVSPLYFVSEYFKGDVARKVYHCLDAAADRERSESFLQDKTEFKIIGRRNSLGRAAVLVNPQDKSKRLHGKEPHFVASSKAIFLLLDCWAVNDKLLTLDLPRESFAKSGQLHVWFLRGGRALWEETLAWPGYGKE